MVVNKTVHDIKTGKSGLEVLNRSIVSMQKEVRTWQFSSLSSFLHEAYDSYAQKCFERFLLFLFFGNHARNCFSSHLCSVVVRRRMFAQLSIQNMILWWNGTKKTKQECRHPCTPDIIKHFILIKMIKKSFSTFFKF